ncbi:MAG: glycosyltransferase [Rubrivivax sp.]|nr:glycosyltransferase [Rubrivivax sp.]
MHAPQSEVAPTSAVTDGERLRVAVVIQRYGADITGGAESHARMVVQRLATRFQVEVLTSCARDHTDWAMFFAPGLENVDGVAVRRFAHPVRNDIGRARVPERHRWRFKLRRLLRLLGWPAVAQPTGDARHDGLEFLRRQGPHCPDLLAWLATSAERYDAVIFFTALYEPTALGLPAWGRRSVLVPLLHDEKPVYLPWFHRVFASAGALLFNTEVERQLAWRLYQPDAVMQDVVGVGIDSVEVLPEAIAAARTRLGIGRRYLLYAGRVDVSKGCPSLLVAFESLSQRLTGGPLADVQLVLMGERFMEVPQQARTVCTGFVASADRDALIAGAAALVIPSRFESLSLVLLEAFAAGTPVVANGDCEVLAAHVKTSGAGQTYRTKSGFVDALEQALKLPDEERRRRGGLGQRYVRERYSWERVMAKYDAALALVMQQPAGRR